MISVFSIYATLPYSFYHSMYIQQTLGVWEVFSHLHIKKGRLEGNKVISVKSTTTLLAQQLFPLKALLSILTLQELR